MGAKKRNLLRNLGINDRANSSLTRSNFNAGTGDAPNAMIWHIVRFDKQYGSSQATVGYATDATVSDKLANLRSANCGRYGYYARNVKTGELTR